MPPINDDKENRPEPAAEPNTALVEGERNPQNPRSTSVRNLDAFPDDLPPDVQNALTLIMGVMMRGSSSPTDPLLDKFNDEHINKYLDGLQQESQQEYELKKTNRWYYLLYVIAALVFLIVVIIFLAPTNPDLLKDILQTLIVVITSFSGGFGLKVLLDRQNQ